MNHFLLRCSSTRARFSVNGVNKLLPWGNSSLRHFCELSENLEDSSWRSMEGLVKCPANYAPLTPISFLERAARVYSDRVSVVYDSLHFTWAETHARCLKLASALVRLGISRGDVVATLAPNIPAMLELHFAVPMAGAIICTLNTRHDPAMISSLLRQSEAKILFSDHHLLNTARSSLSLLSHDKNLKLPILVQIPENTHPHPSPLPDCHDYEALVYSGDDSFVSLRPKTEFDPISINYTSGTTSHPKGVVYNHRGAYINALATSSIHSMSFFPVYLWTVPMFHCNGWCLIWGLAALGGTNVCLRRVSPDQIYHQIALNRVTHMSGAPTVLNMMANSPDRKPLPHKVEIMTGGAPPPEPLLLKIEDLGFKVSHLYGLTETYGPGTWCAWRPEWDSLARDERTRLKARQGIGHFCLEEVDVRDPVKLENSVPADGVTIGEVVFRGNTVMAGYFKDEKATREVFSGGWFRSGDVGVKHRDGYIEIKDRSKDVVITGGENVSSLEVEAVICCHAAVVEVAVVGRPDKHWGETVCAFVKVREGEVGPGEVGPGELMDFCRERLPHYMAPKTVVIGDLPKTATGKVQKFVLRERTKAMGSLT